MLLGFVDFGVKDCKVVAAQVIEHPCLFQVIIFREDAHVGVGFKYFAHKNSVVARCKFTINDAFQVGYALTNCWSLDFFAGNRCQICFFEFVKASASQGAAGVDGLQYLQCWNVHNELP